jgi:hypothetical protein
VLGIPGRYAHLEEAIDISRQQGITIVRLAILSAVGVTNTNLSNMPIWSSAAMKGGCATCAAGITSAGSSTTLLAGTQRPTLPKPVFLEEMKKPKTMHNKGCAVRSLCSPYFYVLGHIRRAVTFAELTAASHRCPKIEDLWGQAPVGGHWECYAMGRKEEAQAAVEDFES